MKRLFLGVCTLMLATVACAQSSLYLTVQRLDGTAESVAIQQNMQVNFQNEALQVHLNGAALFTFPLASLNYFFFDTEPTGIHAATTDGALFRSGALVEVFHLSGRKVATYRQGVGEPPQLPAGLYLFRSEGLSIKQLLP